MELTSGACYAWWSLVITLAIANIGYMADSRAIGYAAAMIPHLAFVGVPELWAALITALPKTTVPRWTAVLALLTIVTIAINAIVFSHNDIR